MMNHFIKVTKKMLLICSLGLVSLGVALGILLALTTPVQANPGLDLISPAEQSVVPPQASHQAHYQAITDTSLLTPSTTGPEFGLDRVGGAIQVSEAPPLPEWVVALQQAHSGSDEISISANEVSVSVSAMSASAKDGSSVINGQTINYTITITNNSQDFDATDISVVNILPTKTQEVDVQCGDGCVKKLWIVPIAPDQLAPDQLYGNTFLPVTYTPQVSWTIPLLRRLERIERVFTVNASCKSEGTILVNQTFIRYQQGGNLGANIADPVETEVVVSNNTVGLANQPSWCSDDVRAVFTLDWGDFDHDGDLDLAVGSTGGINIYRNDQIQLTKVWSNTLSPFSVRWGDFDNSNDFLELVAVGAPITNAINSYINAIYSYNNSTGQFTQAQIFTSARQIFEVAPGDFDGNGVDIIGATDLLQGPPCAISLYRNNGGIANGGDCISNIEGSSTAHAADFNNDGYLDVALGLHIVKLPYSSNPKEARIFRNGGNGNFTITNTIMIDPDVGDFNPYALTPGDYDRDGFLDIAEAIPRENKYLIRIFRNQNGTSFIRVQPEISTSNGNFGPPLDLHWADFNGDGLLDLAVPDFPPRIYLNTGDKDTPFAPNDSSKVLNLPLGFYSPDPSDYLWDIRAGDVDNDGDQDFAFSSIRHLSLAFTNLAPLLAPTLNTIDSFKANSVSWGDVNHDGQLDLLFGAGVTESDLGSRLYSNANGTFSLAAKFASSGFGPHTVDFGDVDRDGRLDVAIAVASSGRTQIYRNGNMVSPDWEFFSAVNTLAFADFDLSNNGSLDLLIGNNGPNQLFLNAGLQAPTSEPIRSFVTENENTRSVAWGYFDNDPLPDIAMGNYGASSRVYRNNSDLTFTPVWTSPVYNTRAIAWGDYDNDGKLDLALGNYGKESHVFRRDGDGFKLVWSSPASKTTSLAWGDWNNDKKLELAVGNDREKDRVYVNLGGPPESPNFVPLWESSESYQTTDLAWGDMDNDGDLDLAISQDGGGQNGVYENTYVLAPHILEPVDHVKAMPLPQNPSYLAFTSPLTPNVVLSKTIELTTTSYLTIPIEFKVHDPDRSRQNCNSDPGEQVKVKSYEYSLNGGGKWHNATVVADEPRNWLKATDPFTSSCVGNSAKVLWGASQDIAANNPNQPVSDDVRFRITIVHLNKTGPTQRASTAAVSPPFRIRDINCVWPDEATFRYRASVDIGVPVIFTGTVPVAQGQVTFNWDFGDGSGGRQGQIVTHAYTRTGNYQITLKVNATVAGRGRGCETIPRQAVTMTTIAISQKLYLPIITTAGDETITSVPLPTPVPEDPEPEGVEGPTLQIATVAGVPQQVKDLSGSTGPDGTSLKWSANAPEDEVAGYRIYWAPLGQMPYRLLAEVPANVTTYTDNTATCGQMYVVTAYNAAGESLPSTSSYFSPPCR